MDSKHRVLLVGVALGGLMAIGCAQTATTDEQPPNEPLQKTPEPEHLSPIPAPENAEPMLPEPPPAKPPTSPTSEKGVLLGQVLNAATGHGVGGVKVVIVGTAQSTFTDVNGQFDFGLIAPGEYTVTVDAQLATCYQAGVTSATVNPDEQTQADIALGRADGLVVKVLGINFDPIINGKPLHEFKGWLSPRELSQDFAEEMSLCSGGFFRYDIVEWIDSNDIPVKDDGFQYTTATYLEAIANDAKVHRPDWADYTSIIERFNLADKINSGEIDEVFLWGGPWFGFYESVMIGPEAFWINGSLPPSDSQEVKRKAVLMGFNYGYTSRDGSIGLMMHSLGHRSESTMVHHFGSWNLDSPQHAWDMFTSYQRWSPNSTGCGNIHFPANVAHAKDYDYSNTLQVKSQCEDFSNWPTSDNQSKDISAEVWNRSERGYLRWWYGHLPSHDGEHNGMYRNWWRYIIDINQCLAQDYLNETVAACCSRWTQ